MSMVEIKVLYTPHLCQLMGFDENGQEIRVTEDNVPQAILDTIKTWNESQKQVAPVQADPPTKKGKVAEPTTPAPTE